MSYFSVKMLSLNAGAEGLLWSRVLPFKLTQLPRSIQTLHSAYTSHMVAIPSSFEAVPFQRGFCLAADLASQVNVSLRLTWINSGADISISEHTYALHGAFVANALLRCMFNSLSCFHIFSTLISHKRSKLNAFFTISGMLGRNNE